MLGESRVPQSRDTKYPGNPGMIQDDPTCLVGGVYSPGNLGIDPTCLPEHSTVPWHGMGARLECHVVG